MKRKNAAAVALGRKGGIKGGPARAAVLTPEQRSLSARNAVMARWAKAKGTTVARRKVMNNGKKLVDQKKAAHTHPVDKTDEALLNLLNRLKTTVDPAEIRELSDQIERVVFHKQFRNA